MDSENAGWKTKSTRPHKICQKLDTGHTISLRKHQNDTLNMIIGTSKLAITLYTAEEAEEEKLFFIN